MIRCKGNLLLLFCIITHCSSSPIEEEAEGKKPSKKIYDKDFKDVVKDLTKLVKDIPIENFEGDTIVEQFVDKLNDATTYKVVGSDKKSPSLYERNSNDLEQEVVILLPSEDSITVRRAKRTFVGLRRADKDDQSRYFIFNIYLRNPKDDEIGEKVGSENRIVEYDTWENRDLQAAKHSDKVSGWDECGPSIFLPCKSSEAPGMAPPRKQKKKSSKNSSDEHNDEDKKKAEHSKKIKENELEKVKCGSGDDPDEIIDFFWDIQDDLVRGRAMGGRFFNLLGGLVNGIGNLVGGVVGGVVNSVVGLIEGVLQAGIGIIGSFGMFGGLGTKEAKPETVGNALAINGVAKGVNDLPDQYEYEAEKEFKNQASGGLGGLVALEITIDIPDSEETTPKPKKKKKKKKVTTAAPILTTTTMEPTVPSTIAPEITSTAPLVMSETLVTNPTTPKPTTTKPPTTTTTKPTTTAPPKPKTTPAASSAVATEDEGEEDESTTSISILDLNEGVPGLVTDISDDGTITETLGYGVDISGRGISSFFNAAIKKVKNVLGLGEELPVVVDTEPGWKTRDEAGSPNDTLDHESSVFVGFGGCAYKRVSQADFDVAETPDEVTLLLATALRTHCVKRDLKLYDGLFQDGLLKMNKDKTFEIVTSSKYAKMEKLKPRRRSDLARALELSVFSKAFNAELYSTSPQRTLVSGTTGSRRVHTLITTLSQGVELVRTKLRLHEIMLLRILAKTAKTAFAKLLQDDEAIEDCEDCDLDKQVNLEDKNKIMAIIQFILHGQGSLEKKPGSIQQEFESFTKENEKAISQRVDSYTH